MNYNLNDHQSTAKKISAGRALLSLWPYMRADRMILAFALVALLANSVVNLLAPLLIAHVVDAYITKSLFSGIELFGALLFGLYLVGLMTSYLQTRLMGGVGQRVLFSLRNAIFDKLQALPVAFFNANKSGDLISRINNDTDKLNQFFSQTLVQFMGSIFIMSGAAVFLLSLNLALGATALAPAAVLLLFVSIVSPWVKRKNAESLKSTGGLSAEVQEGLENFKVIVAFNRRDFFHERFLAANNENYTAAIGAGIANNVFTPVFGIAANLAQLAVLAYGIYLITLGNFTIGLLVGFLAYVTNFYSPLRQLAGLWASFQTALASWDRISAIMQMSGKMEVLPVGAPAEKNSNAVLEFRDVSFGYTEDKKVLHDVNFTLEHGKTYALVGPTGGGKTTTASLMSRLYDATSGTILLDGQNIRSFTRAELTKRVGFILQEPILFTGTVRDNILYGNEKYKDYSAEQLQQVFTDAGLEKLLERFDGGLAAEVAVTGDTLSLGQKQLIAFMRALLRAPELLILDEATANIDTVTEKQLDEILNKLPKTTTKVIIAHRLNTIENADMIFFVNSGAITPAGGMEDALEMLLHGKRDS